MSTPRIVLAPGRPESFVAAIEQGGGELVEPGGDADGLVWLDSRDADGLREAVDATPSVRWVQLPLAGVEAFAGQRLFADGRTWTSAKGAYGPPVAEHALALALAGLRHLPERVRADSWGEAAGTSLFDADVTILGGGGITEELVALLAPLRTRITVVRRRPDPFPGVHRTLTTDRLDEALTDALVVFVAWALTPDTKGLIDRRRLAAMDRSAWLINVARGGHVVTDDLVAALRSGEIGGAGLDVTDPEPLPPCHPLWGLDNCIITPHTADTPEMVMPLLAERVRTNVARRAAGEPLIGLVDPDAGY